jgi:hypothetical protein
MSAGSTLGIEPTVSPGQHSQLYDAPGSRDHYEQHAQDGGEKQGNT